MLEFRTPYNGGSDLPFIVTWASSSWREGQPQLARRRQRRVRGLLTSSFRTGPSTGALSIKEGRVLSSLARSCIIPDFNHQNGQTAPYVALMCTFGVISSLRGAAAEGPSFRRLARRAWRGPSVLILAGAGSLTRRFLNLCNGAKRSGR